jgi:chemotaxis signal transduction protein
MVVGLCCDRVLGVRHVPLDQLEPPRIHTSASLAPYVTAEVHGESEVLARLNLGALLKAARVSA